MAWCQVYQAISDMIYIWITCQKTLKQLSTHWGRVTHICVGNLTIIDSDNGLSPCRSQAIIWINAGLLLIGALGTNFSEIKIEISAFSFKKMHLEMPSGRCWPFCLGLDELSGSDIKHDPFPCVNMRNNCCHTCIMYAWIIVSIHLK